MTLAEDIERAATLAERAFAEFGRWPGARRAAFLRAIAAEIEAAAGDIQARAHQETALPLPRLQAETGRTCGQLRLFADLAEDGWWCDARIDRADPARTPPKPDLRSLRVPLGPVAVFAPSNFPLAFSVAGGDTASALAAGCPVIVKPHPGHPGTSELVAQCIARAADECGAPDGVFSMLHDHGTEAGLALVRHPAVAAVGFTGSHAAGHALMDAVAARPVPIPVYAEMGSVNPVFLLPGALAERAPAIAAGLHASVTLGVGQFCTNPGLVFVADGPGADTFVAELGRLLVGTAPATMLTAETCVAYRDGLDRLAARPGVRTLARVESEPGMGGAALFACDAAAFLADPGLAEEVFGPCTLVVGCGSGEEMLAAAAKLPGQLTATVHGTPDELAGHEALLALLVRRAGRVIHDGFPTGVEVAHAMTHGGPYPATSDGRSTSVGSRAIERFTRPVSFQDWPDALLPPELQDANPLGIHRFVDGVFTGP